MKNIEVILTTICILFCAWAIGSWALTAFGVEPEWFEAINFWRVVVGL